VTDPQGTPVSVNSSSSHHERSFDCRSQILCSASAAVQEPLAASRYPWWHAPARRRQRDEPRLVDTCVRGVRQSRPSRRRDRRRLTQVRRPGLCHPRLKDTVLSEARTLRAA